MRPMDDCGLSNATIAVGEWMMYMVYTFLLPPYLVLGLTGTIILLITFYKKSKKEHVYVYQVLLTVSKTLEVLAFGGFQLGTGWFSGVRGKPADWYRKSYVLMWTNFTFGPPAHMHMIMSSLMLSVAMAADRVFAMTLPLKYNKINHKKHQIIATTICSTLPAVSTLSYALIINILRVGDHYETDFNQAFTASTLGKVCSRLGLLIRIICICLLILSNIVMIVSFRKRAEKIAKMTSISEQKEARKTANKTLFLLNVWQSVLMCFNQLPHITLHALMFIVPSFDLCQGSIANPLADSFIFITDSIDLIVVTAINKKMRRSVFDAVRCGKNQVNPEPA